MGLDWLKALHKSVKAKASIQQAVSELISGVLESSRGVNAVQRLSANTPLGLGARLLLSRAKELQNNVSARDLGSATYATLVRGAMDDFIADAPMVVVGVYDLTAIGIVEKAAAHGGNVVLVGVGESHGKTVGGGVASPDPYPPWLVPYLQLSRVRTLDGRLAHASGAHHMSSIHHNFRLFLIAAHRTASSGGAAPEQVLLACDSALVHVVDLSAQMDELGREALAQLLLPQPQRGRLNLHHSTPTLATADIEKASGSAGHRDNPPQVNTAAGRAAESNLRAEYASRPHSATLLARNLAAVHGLQCAITDIALASVGLVDESLAQSVQAVHSAKVSLVSDVGHALTPERRVVWPCVPLRELERMVVPRPASLGSAAQVLASKGLAKLASRGGSFRSARERRGTTVLSRRDASLRKLREAIHHSAATFDQRGARTLIPRGSAAGAQDPTTAAQAGASALRALAGVSAPVLALASCLPHLHPSYAWGCDEVLEVLRKAAWDWADECVVVATMGTLREESNLQGEDGTQLDADATKRRRPPWHMNRHRVTPLSQALSEVITGPTDVLSLCAFATNAVLLHMSVTMVSKGCAKSDTLW